MSEAIRREYKKAGLKAPDGKGIHTLAAHKCVIAYLKKGVAESEAWRRCIGGMGKAAIKKAHRRTV